MKQVFMSVAVVALMAAAVACGNNANKKAQAAAEEAKTECAEAKECSESKECSEKNALEAAANEAVEAVKDAATEKAVEGINAAADAAVEAIKK